jgi:hypothetical protein
VGFIWFELLASMEGGGTLAPHQFAQEEEGEGPVGPEAVRSETLKMESGSFLHHFKGWGGVAVRPK